MPALQLWTCQLPTRGLTKDERRKLHEELNACTEVKGTIRNNVERFMVDSGIRHIEELDYDRRLAYEEWLDKKLTYGTIIAYLTGFDIGIE